MVPVPDTRHADIRTQIARLGIKQGDDPILRCTAQPLELPSQVETARSTLGQLHDTIRQLRGLHRFTNGVGIAAPQLGLSLAVALVRPVGDYPIRLINPRIIDSSPEIEVQYEGCLSFFDFRGLVARPTWVTVQSSDLRGRTLTRTHTGAIARLVIHEIDHLNGRLYVDLMQDEGDLVDIADYNSQRWR